MGSSISKQHVSPCSARERVDIVVACLFILLGGAFLYQTAQMTNPVFYRFPCTVVAGLMAVLLISIVTSLARPYLGVTEPILSARTGFNNRRILLLVSMLAAALMMPWVGLALSEVGAFAALMLLDEGAPRKQGWVWLYCLIAVSVVCGFYAVFRYLLNVPLAEGGVIQFP